MMPLVIIHDCILFRYRKKLREGKRDSTMTETLTISVMADAAQNMSLIRTESRKVSQKICT